MYVVYVYVLMHKITSGKVADGWKLDVISESVNMNVQGYVLKKFFMIYKIRSVLTVNNVQAEEFSNRLVSG